VSGNHIINDSDLVLWISQHMVPQHVDAPATLVVIKRMETLLKSLLAKTWAHNLYIISEAQNCLWNMKGNG